VESGYGLFRRPEDGGEDDLLDYWRDGDEAVKTRLAGGDCSIGLDSAQGSAL
jgi:hypothetical protein